MGMMSSKKEKEKWVVNEFLPRYNKIKGSDYSLVKMIEEEGMPDSIIANSKGEKLGLEVTEYTGYPRTEAGRKKSKENQFWDIMEEKLKDCESYRFTFYPTSYPSEKDKMEGLAEKVAHGIKKCISKGEQKGKFKIDDVEGSFCKGAFNESGSRVGFYINLLTRDNSVKGMYELMWKKVNDARKYKNQEKNILVMHQNASEVGFIDDLEKIIELKRQNLRKKKLIDVYEEIWLLYGKKIHFVY